MEATFFTTPAAFRSWLDEHHDQERELWVGYYKKATGIPSITWPESVAQAICYGWIDGLRKSIDEQRYRIRFTPRKKTSFWSAVNLKMVKELIEAGLMTPAGMTAYEARDERKSQRYAYERKNVKLAPAYLAKLQANDKAWDFFQQLPPSAKQASIWWVMQAKRDDTQQKRLKTLIECSAEGLRIPPIRRRK